MKHIASLDSAKLVAAFCVVLMHAQLAGTSVLLPVLKLAVPLFFLISGYCLVTDEGVLRRDSMQRSLKRLAGVTFWANLAYLLWHTLRWWLWPTVYANPLPSLLESTCWTRFFCYGDSFSGHLWYLIAYLQVLLFFLLLVRRPASVTGALRGDRVPSWLYGFIPVGLLLNLLLGNYGFLLGMHNSYAVSRNFFTIALPCVLLGMFVHQWQERLSAASRLIVWLLPASGAFLYAEALLYRLYCPEHTGDVWFFTVPVAAIILLYLLQHPHSGAARLSLWGKRYSLPVYVWHFLAIEVLRTLYSYFFS